MTDYTKLRLKLMALHLVLAFCSVILFVYAVQIGTVIVVATLRELKVLP